MKRMLSAVLVAAMLIFAGCSGSTAPDTGFTKYSTQFFGTFDTVVQVVGYCRTEEDFTAYSQKIKDRFTELNNLYDIYYEYSGINNIKTINDNAGISPVKVDEEILDLIEFCLDWYGKTDGQVNIALGPVLSVWHQYMSRYSSDSEGAKIPSEERLREATAHTDISKVIVDREAGTVYLADEGMSLDVGAVAKGYAAELVSREIYAEGFTSFAISAGGNVVTGDAPLDGVRAAWGIGIQNPFIYEDATQESSLDVVFVENESVVTSGDYQRYYMYNGKRIHHIIDPATLMPADYYRSVSIITGDSGVADLASTTLYTLPYDESRALAEKMDWKAMWVFADGTVECTDDLIPMLYNRGKATGLLAQ